MSHSNIVGGSTAKRLINCPGSRKLVAEMPPQPSSVHADRGTMLHDVISRVLLDQGVVIGQYKHKDQLLTQELYDEKIAPALDALDEIDPAKIFLVQLSDFMWQETPTFEERMTTARTFRVFPGEGVHSEQLADLVLRLERMGYSGDFSFEVFNDDYQQLPLATVAERARRSALWLHQDVLHRSAPLPDWTLTR